MRVRVEHSIGDLANDLGAIPEKVVLKGAKVVRKNVRAGRNAARRHARDKAGPHGKDYYKRITDEMTGALEGEYGPTALKGEAYIGAGYRNAAPNNDLPYSQDIIGPKFAKGVSDLVGDVFREAEFR